jgi:uncharacterized lipoprotein YmbA
MSRTHALSSLLLPSWSWLLPTRALLLCLLSACASSPPLRFYTLSEIAPQARITSSQAIPVAIPVRVDRITIPAELDRPQLVRRIDANRVEIAESDRWAAPLDDMILRVFSADLAARLPEKMVMIPSRPTAGQQTRTLSVDVLEFFGDSSCAVTLRAAWLLKPPNAPGARGVEEIHVPPTGGCAPDALPAVMSQALAQMSERVAAVIAR